MTDDFELSGDAPQKPKVKKPKYTEAFERWWKAYPRKTAKIKAFQSWQANVDEAEDAKVVIADTEKRNRLQFWAADKSKIPMPTTFLNQRRWEDEWEDEVRTRGREHTTAPHASRPMPQEKIEDEHQLSGWQQMMNRLMRSYLLRCGGLADAQLRVLTKLKNQTFKEMETAINEEIDAADDKRAARGEMAFLLADTFLGRADAALGYHHKPAIIAEGRANASR